ncbi:hypothetical protein AAFF_G00103880 [Aldrovandia affinis]|uniref:Uncharacterized protein n=1 Tax=Aldrovandia affinis TaxID=143900 RepID=A0AAD7RUL1_9TELE|nr:hypothetical protein AAFF_G00103880 [Aldrovandia affinis]
MNWSNREAVEELRDCLGSTDWDTFRTASNNLDEYTEAVTSYISFCVDICIPTRTRVSYNNDKPWFTARLRQLRLEKERAFKSGDKDRLRLARYTFTKAIKEAKRQYSERLEQQVSANDSASVWRGLREITNYKTKSPHSMNDLRLTNDLNEFYCRFDRQWNSPDSDPDSDSHTQPPPNSYHISFISFIQPEQRHPPFYSRPRHLQTAPAPHHTSLHFGE